MATGEESDLETGHDEFFDNLCSVCNRKNKKTEAQKFCTDCQEYFCSNCVNSHDDFPALRNHKILDKPKFQPGSSVQYPTGPTERCKVHGHKPVDMYCRQHDAVGCSTCMVMQHSACKDKVYVSDYIKNNKVENSSTISKELGTLASSLDKFQKYFLSEKKNLQSQKETSMQEISKLRIQINQRLDELEKNTVQDLESVYQSLSDKIEATLGELQAAITEVRSAQDSLKSTSGNESQMFVSIKMAEHVVFQVYEKVTETQHQAAKAEISFVSNQKIQSLFNELEVLGSFNMPAKMASQPRNPGLLPVKAKTQTTTTSNDNKSSILLLKVKGSQKYTVKNKGGIEMLFMSKTSCITSACVLENGNVILADHNNKSVKRLDSSYTYRDFCKISGQPWQMCAMGNEGVAVTCKCTNNDPKIQFVSIGYHMEETRQIKTDFNCVGLAYADDKLFVSDEEKSVYVYTIKGDRLQQFFVPQLENSYLSASSSPSLLSLAVSSDGSTIYVAHRKKGLIMLNRNGKIVGQFTDPKLVGASSVCLYKNNSVLVCGSNTVFQFSLDGQLIGKVLKSDKTCECVCYCKTNSKLIVGSEDDQIEVYDIIK